MTGPPDLSPEEAVERWLDRQRTERRDASVTSYQYRLKLWLAWCEDEGIDSVSELTAWDNERYETHRRGEGVAVNTLKSELMTLRQFERWLARVDLVDESVPESIDPPTVEKGEGSSDVKLASEDAHALLDYYREATDSDSRAWALVELLWWTGARLGGIHSLDTSDVDLDDRWVRFEHRVNTGTRLKNGIDGERYVGLEDEQVAALRAYLDSEDRADVHDDHGRQPLFTTYAGRPGKNTLRQWCYRATQPCVHGPCPHDQDPNTCDYRAYAAASQCPSSRAPHHIRTGSITWMLDCGMGIETVADRVNSTPENIRRHYDKSEPRREMERRRRDHLDKLGFDSDSDADSDSEDTNE